MNIGDYLQTEALKFLSGQSPSTAPISLEIALSSTDPGATGSGITEISGGGYARQAFTFSAPVTTEVNGSQASNSNALTFSNMPSGNVSHYAIFDAGGNLYIYGELAVVRSLTSGDNLSFDIGTFVLSSGSFLSAFSGEALVNYLKGTDFPFVTTVDLGFSKADPLRDGSGLDEPSITDGYGRESSTFSVPTYNSGLQRTEVNISTNILLGPSHTNSWGTLTYVVFFDQSSNILMYGELANPTTNVLGSGEGAAVGGFPLYLD